MSVLRRARGVRCSAFADLLRAAGRDAEVGPHARALRQDQRADPARRGPEPGPRILDGRLVVDNLGPLKGLRTRLAALEGETPHPLTFRFDQAGLVLGEFRRIADGAPDDPRDQLTERETEILKMVATGMSYKQIASRLVLSHRTVQNHVQNTLRKLQMNNRVQLTRWTIEHGLDDTTE